MIHSTIPWICWLLYHILRYVEEWRGLTDYIRPGPIVMSSMIKCKIHFFQYFPFSFTRSFYLPYVLEEVCIISAFIAWQATGNSWAGLLNEILSIRGWKAVNLVNVIKMKHSLFSKVKLIICVEVSLRDKWHFRLWFVTPWIYLFHIFKHFL